MGIVYVNDIYIRYDGVVRKYNKCEQMTWIVRWNEDTVVDREPTEVHKNELMNNLKTQMKRLDSLDEPIFTIYFSLKTPITKKQIARILPKTFVKIFANAFNVQFFLRDFKNNKFCMQFRRAKRLSKVTKY